MRLLKTYSTHKTAPIMTIFLLLCFRKGAPGIHTCVTPDDRECESRAYGE